MDFTPNSATFLRSIKPESIRQETKNFSDITGYVYVIQKRFSPDNGKFNQPINLIKIGFSSLDTRVGGDKGLARLSGFLTTLISFKVLRLYLFTRSDFAAERADKKEEYARNANKLERDLQFFTENEFNPPIIRIAFRTGSKSEWFAIQEGNRLETFLKKIDDYAYKSSLYTPIYGTAFTANSAKKINIQAAPKITGIIVDPNSGTLKERDQIRKTTSKYGYNLRQRKEADYKEQKEAEIKKKDQQNRKKLMKDVSFWKKAFLGRTFKDDHMSDQSKAADKKYPNKIVDDVYEATENGRKQPLVHYKPNYRETRNKKISEVDFDLASGSMSINEMMDLYFKDLKTKYKEEFEFFQRMNGASDLLIGND